MRSAYSKDGDYLGSPKYAYRLVHKFGVRHFEKVASDHGVCSIGFAPKLQEWYGWSHRAIYGFTIGSTCKKGDCHYIPKTFGEIKSDCYAREDNMCHANASVPVAPVDPSKPEGIQVASGPVEGVVPCLKKNCVFETGRGEWTAENLQDAKQMAIDFASGVS